MKINLKEYFALQSLIIACFWSIVLEFHLFLRVLILHIE